MRELPSLECLRRPGLVKGWALPAMARGAGVGAVLGAGLSLLVGSLVLLLVERRAWTGREGAALVLVCAALPVAAAAGLALASGVAAVLAGLCRLLVGAASARSGVP